MKHVLFIFHIIICALTVYLVPDNYEYSIYIGVLALAYSLLTVFRVKGRKELVILFSIIFYINLSVFVLGPLTRGLMFGAYQYELWISQYDTIGMKSILITSVIFYLVFNAHKKKIQRSINDDRIKLTIKQNSLISIVCLIGVLLICTYSFTGAVEAGEYVSNQSALYEYVILIMVIAWYYGGKKPYLAMLWVLCAAYYVLLGIMAGDRSSAFMLLTLIILYKMHDVSVSKIVLFCLVGIFAANTVAMFRTGDLAGASGIGLVTQGLKSFFSDTAAQSYYSGLTIYYYLDKIGNGVTLFFNWILTLFTGSLFVDRSSVELSSLAFDYNPNGGGGLFQPQFFAFYGYVGVALGALLVSYIISKIYFTWNNAYCLMLRYLIPVMCFRWYLYTPTTFFRACLFNFGIMYLATKIFDSVFGGSQAKKMPMRKI